MKEQKLNYAKAQNLGAVHTHTDSLKKEASGITLVALVVTIVILLILAGVSINLVLGNNGIIDKAKEAKNKTNAKDAEEMTVLNEAGDWINEQLGETSKTPISKDKSYVGCYADIDGDGTVDGVIYADLAVGGSGKWWSDDGKYTIPKIEDKASLKDYYVSQTSYMKNEGFGTHEVISPVDKNAEGVQRFYIMALEDSSYLKEAYGETYTRTDYSWYEKADGKMEDFATTTSLDFGEGRTNTNNMMAKWNLASYGEKYGDDIWGKIQSEVEKGWFVPSSAEWAAFEEAFKVEDEELWGMSGYKFKFALSGSYWSSSQADTESVWAADFYHEVIDNYGVYCDLCVRLSTTF